MANTEKHKKKVEEFLRGLAKKGLLYEHSCDLKTREIKYQFTQKGLMFGGKKLLKGIQ